MQPTVLAPFTARDGENLAVYDWPLDEWTLGLGLEPAPPRALVLMVHGLGEHVGRYAQVAHKLLDWGFAVRAYDQRGHGESGGARGVLPSDDALLEDLAEIVDDTRRHSLQPEGVTEPLPLILLGHSLGGLVVSRFVSLGLRPVDGLVLSSPALDAGLNPLQKLLLSVLPRVAPDLTVGNGLDERYLSHDPRVLAAYRADRLVHNRISARLGRFIADNGPPTIAAAAQWSTPTLLLYAGADRLVNPAGSRAFVRAAAASAQVKPGMVTSQCFDGLYHELFNEQFPTPVFDALKAWLDARF